jgi:hypothetical protein
MNRANLFMTRFSIWFIILAVVSAWLLTEQGSFLANYLIAIRILRLRFKMMLDLLKLKERHLWEDIALRQAGCQNGIWIWETTIGLARKTVAYLCVRFLNGLLQ